VFFSNAQTNAKKYKRATKQPNKDTANLTQQIVDRKEAQQVTAVWQKWRFNAWYDSFS